MTTYSLPSDRAYVEKLQVLKAGQRWFAFDVPMDSARKGNATRFGMTVWNFHCVDGTSDFERWGITRDAETGDYWYRVAKMRGGEISKNRKSLWDALHIAANMTKPFPMRAILKDGKSHQCSAEHVFNINEVLLQQDGSALWLRLAVPTENVGTECEVASVPALTPLAGAEPTRQVRSRALPEEHYMAIRDAAVRTHFEGSHRSAELDALATAYGINEDTASANLNNFRCLLEGKTFKAPMQAFGLQLFIDTIVARLGDAAVPNIVRATEGYIDYARTVLKQSARGFQAILDELKLEASQAQVVKRALQEGALSAAGATGRSSDCEYGQRLTSAASELLREVWVRGPQHAAFRRALQRRWGDKCSVHGVNCNEQLRASHIVPWSQDEALRGDVNNGLLLSVPLDNLFDRGLISFDDTGTVILSDKLTADTCKHFEVHPGLRIAWDHLSELDRVSLRTSLARHRAQHGLSEKLKP